MPVTETKEAGRAVATNAHAAHAARMADAKAARTQAQAELAARHAADALFPPEQVGTVPLASVPEPPAAPEPTAAPRSLVLSVTILHRGRMITIASEGRSLDAFCDMLDARLGVPS